MTLPEYSTDCNCPQALELKAGIREAHFLLTAGKFQDGNARAVQILEKLLPKRL